MAGIGRHFSKPPRVRGARGLKSTLRESTMNIAVLGLGNVGSALGSRLAEAGHQVTFGVRKKDDEKAKAQAKGMGAGIESIAEAAARSEVVMLCVPWKAALDAVAAAG